MFRALIIDNALTVPYKVEDGDQDLLLLTAKLYFRIWMSTLLLPGKSLYLNRIMVQHTTLKEHVFKLSMLRV